MGGRDHIKSKILKNKNKEENEGNQKYRKLQKPQSSGLRPDTPLSPNRPQGGGGGLSESGPREPRSSWRLRPLMGNCAAARTAAAEIARRGRRRALLPLTR